MAYCNKCGKQIRDGYAICYECNQKKVEQKKQKKPEGEQKGIDLSKEVTLPLWTILTIILLAAIFGAWAF